MFGTIEFETYIRKAKMLSILPSMRHKVLYTIYTSFNIKDG